MDNDYNYQKYKEIAEDVEQGWNEKLKSEARERLQGKVANFNREKGIGFIKVDNQPDIFFRAEDVLDGSYLRYNDIISFSLIKNPRGMRAVQIKLIESAPKPPSPPKQTRQKQNGVVKWFKPDIGL